MKARSKTDPFPPPFDILRFGNVLQQLGQMTMAIFLAHTIFSAATRIVFLKLGVNDPIIHLTLGTATGVIGPTVMYHLAQRLNLSRVLGF